MDTITRVAHDKGCIVGWDLAHAIGNVELKMDEWGVDFATWCTYKVSKKKKKLNIHEIPVREFESLIHICYTNLLMIVCLLCLVSFQYLNSGAGCIGGAYVNKRHSGRRGQLRGWFGNSKETRFQMLDQIDLAPGVEGFKLSNTSPILIACVMPSLKVITCYFEAR